MFSYLYLTVLQKIHHHSEYLCYNDKHYFCCSCICFAKWSWLLAYGLHKAYRSDRNCLKYCNNSMDYFKLVLSLTVH